MRDHAMRAYPGSYDPVPCRSGPTPHHPQHPHPEHGEITTKYIMLILESLPFLHACVLPTPTIEAARQNCLLLQQFATGSTSSLDYNALVL